MVAFMAAVRPVLISIKPQRPGKGVPVLKRPDSGRLMHSLPYQEVAIMVISLLILIHMLSNTSAREYTSASSAKFFTIYKTVEVLCE